MVRSDNFSARIAFVDYDGKSAFEDYKAHSPLSEPEEERFVERNAPNMVRGVETLRRYIEDLNK
jgi:aspartate aminotransferase